MKTAVLTLALFAASAAAHVQAPADPAKPQVAIFMHQTLGESWEEFLRVTRINVTTCMAQGNPNPLPSEWCETLFKKIEAGDTATLTNSNSSGSISLFFSGKKLAQVLVMTKTDWVQAVAELTQTYGAPDAQTATSATWSFADGGGISASVQAGSLVTMSFYSKDGKGERVPAPAAQEPTPLSVMEYTLGESISVHNKTEIDNCNNIPKQLTVDDVKADKTISPGIRSFYIDQAKSGKLWTREPLDYHEKCDGLIAAINDGTRWSKPLSGASYEGGQLVSFETLVGETNEIVLADAIAKFGKPTRQTTVPYQNGFGAKWVDRISEWELPNGFVQLYESNKPGDGRPLITIETTKEHQREAAERKSKGNSLDHPRS